MWAVIGIGCAACVVAWFVDEISACVESQGKTEAARQQ
jgi:hypothetical protein